MRADFKGKKLGFFGIQGSGKTEAMKRIVKKCFDKPFVYRVNNDFDTENVYLYSPENKYDREEFNFVIGRAIKLAEEGKIDCIVIDEINVFIPNNYALNDMQNVADLMANHRHYGVAVLFATRRPQDTATQISDTAHYLFVYPIEGANAIKRLNEIDPRISDTLKTCEYGRYDYVLKELGKEPKKMRAL